MGQVRVDRWLSAARIYKSRTHSALACSGGHVKIGNTSVKPSHPVRVGDTVHARAPRGDCKLEIVALAAKRLSPALARELYIDHSPPPPPREQRPSLPQRARGAGRPTKADRRALAKFRRELDSRD